MKSSSIIVFVAVCAMVVAVYASPPSGSYCGDYAGMFKLKVTVLNTTALNMTGNVFGTPYTCAPEAWSLSTSNQVNLPGLSNPNDCLYKILHNEGIDPASVTVQYNPAPTNDMVCSTAFGDLTLTSC